MRKFYPLLESFHIPHDSSLGCTLGLRGGYLSHNYNTYSLGCTIWGRYWTKDPVQGLCTGSLAEPRSFHTLAEPRLWCRHIPVGLMVSSLHHSWPGPITATWKMLMSTLIRKLRSTDWAPEQFSGNRQCLASWNRSPPGMLAGYIMGSPRPLDTPSSGQPPVNVTWDQHPV